MTAQIRSNFKTNMARPRYRMLRQGAEVSGTVFTTIFSSREADPRCRYCTSHCASHSRTALCPQTHYWVLPRSYSVLRLEFEMVVQVLCSKKLINQLWVLKCCKRKSYKNHTIRILLVMPLEILYSLNKNKIRYTERQRKFRFGVFLIFTVLGIRREDNTTYPA